METNERQKSFPLRCRYKYIYIEPQTLAGDRNYF